MKYQLIIPVYNPDEKLNKLLMMIARQTIKSPVIIVDSGSDKKYLKYASEIKDVEVVDIPSSEFDHGGTRQWAINYRNDADIYCFLTQDAILCDDLALERIFSCFDNEDVGCAYGRQFPHQDATILSSFARTYNYSAVSYKRTFEDRKKCGIKTVFISNSFAAYRKKAMDEVGGFPSHVILSEDMYVAAKMLLKGWSIAYNANAGVYHSHNFSIIEEFKRYFDIGVFHHNEKWIREKFGESESSGVEYLRAEIKQFKNSISNVINAMFRDCVKYIGYRIGLNEDKIPIFLKKRMSSNAKYWS